MNRTRAGKPVTIGVILNSLTFPYESTIVTGISQRLESVGGRAICFCGGAIESPFGLEAASNVLYQHISNRLLDGLIVLTGTLVNWSGLDPLRALREKWKLPLVTIGLPLDDAPVIKSKVSAGFRTILAHLVREHGHRKIGFISGPSNNDEAQERLAVYRATLTDLGIEVDRNWIVHSNFRHEGGGRGVSLLLDDRRLKLDCLVCANDSMALGALEALNERGLIVPRDIAVVGLDDIEQATYSSPPLTTVRQPLRKIGDRAAQLLCEFLSGAPWDESAATLEGEIVIRRSCGCSWEDDVSSKWASSPESASDEGMRPLFDLLLAEIRDEEQPGAFLERLESMVEPMVGTATDMTQFRALLWKIRSRMLPVVASDINLLLRAEDTLRAANALVASVSTRTQARLRFATQQRLRTLGAVSRMLVETPYEQDTNPLLSDLGIERLSITRWAGENKLRVLFPAVSDTAPYDSDMLVPAELQPPSRSSTVVLPFARKGTQLGLLIFQLRRGQSLFDGTTFEELRDHVASAIAQMEHEIQLAQHDEALSRALDTVENSSKKLENAERLANVGRMAAGVAHEMSTPLTALRATLTEITQWLEDHRTAELSESALADLRQGVTVAVRATDHALNVLGVVKAHARDSAHQTPRAFDAIVAAQETAKLLQHLARRYSCTIELNAKNDALANERPQAVLYGIPSIFAQILTNLIVNALDAYRVAQRQGAVRLTIQLDSEAKQLIVSVADEGCGIDEENLSRVFEPLFTTKTEDGTGIGLSLVHEHTTSHFRGTVSVRSVLREGTTFTLRLPLFQGNSNA